MGIKKVAKTSAVLELGKNSVVLLWLQFRSSSSKLLCVNDVFSHVKMRQSWSPGAKPLCPTDDVTASLASYKTTFYLQNLHDLANLFFLTNITKLAILFYLQKLPGLETNFWATRPRPQRFETKTGAKQPRPRPRPQKIGLETKTDLETYSPGHYRKNY